MKDIYAGICERLPSYRGLLGADIYPHPPMDYILFYNSSVFWCKKRLCDHAWRSHRPKTVNFFVSPGNQLSALPQRCLFDTCNEFRMSIIVHGDDMNSICTQQSQSQFVVCLEMYSRGGLVIHLAIPGIHIVRSPPLKSTWKRSCSDITPSKMKHA